MGTVWYVSTVISFYYSHCNLSLFYIENLPMKPIQTYCKQFKNGIKTPTNSSKTSIRIVTPLAALQTISDTNDTKYEEKKKICDICRSPDGTIIQCISCEIPAHLVCYYGQKSHKKLKDKEWFVFFFNIIYYICFFFSYRKCDACLQPKQPSCFMCPSTKHHLMQGDDSRWFHHVGSLFNFCFYFFF